MDIIAITTVQLPERPLPLTIARAAGHQGRGPRAPDPQPPPGMQGATDKCRRWERSGGREAARRHELGANIASAPP